MKFPRDAPQRKVIKTLESLGFRIMRVGNHISMIRQNPDGSRTPLTMPNHSVIVAPTMRSICTQAGISREEFLKAYEKV